MKIKLWKFNYLRLVGGEGPYAGSSQSGYASVGVEGISRGFQILMMKPPQRKIAYVIFRGRTPATQYGSFTVFSMFPTMAIVFCCVSESCPESKLIMDK